MSVLSSYFRKTDNTCYSGLSPSLYSCSDSLEAKNLAVSTVVPNYIKLTALAVVIASLTAGCGSTDTLVLSNSLSSDFQLRLNTAEQYEAGFNFNSNPSAEKVTAESQRAGSNAKVQYSLNEPLKGKLRSLMRAKFGSVTNSSDNQVTFTIESVEASSEDGVHRVQMTSSIEIQREGETYSRQVSRTLTTPIERVTGNMQPTISISEQDVEEFMLQFVVATDSFIDSNFGVD